MSGHWAVTWYESFTGAWHDLVGDEAVCRARYADALLLEQRVELVDPTGTVVESFMIGGDR